MVRLNQKSLWRQNQRVGSSDRKSWGRMFIRQKVFLNEISLPFSRFMTRRKPKSCFPMLRRAFLYPLMADNPRSTAALASFHCTHKNNNKLKLETPEQQGSRSIHARTAQNRQTHAGHKPPPGFYLLSGFWQL